MIHQGKKGSITFFYKDKLIASSPLSKKKKPSLYIIAKLVVLLLME